MRVLFDVYGSDHDRTSSSHTAGAAKIVGINGAGVDFSGKHNLLFVTYRDTPGMMALLGDGLGARSINVAYAQISRNKHTGEATAIMKLDQTCLDELVRHFRSQPGITDVVAINKLGSEYERTEED